MGRYVGQTDTEGAFFTYRGQPAYHTGDLAEWTENGEVIICIRDDCRAFDPRSRLEQFRPDDVTENIGIRMIAGLADEMNYQCTAGINTLLIRV